MRRRFTRKIANAQRMRRCARGSVALQDRRGRARRGSTASTARLACYVCKRSSSCGKGLGWPQPFSTAHRPCIARAAAAAEGARTCRRGPLFQNCWLCATTPAARGLMCWQASCPQLAAPRRAQVRSVALQSPGDAEGDEFSEAWRISLAREQLTALAMDAILGVPTCKSFQARPRRRFGEPVVASGPDT